MEAKELGIVLYIVSSSVVLDSAVADSITVSEVVVVLDSAVEDSISVVLESSVVVVIHVIVLVPYIVSSSASVL